MNIKLPDFKDSRCEGFVACGELIRDKKRKIYFQKKDSTFFGRYKGEKENVYLRIIIPESKQDLHLHIDCYSTSYFGKDNTPKGKSQITKIRKILDYYSDYSIDLQVTAKFNILYKNLPEGVIRFLTSKREIDSIESRMTGGALSFTGLPIREITFQLSTNGDRIYITITGNKTEKFDNDYLLRLSNWIEKQFNFYVLGKTKNDKK